MNIMGCHRFGKVQEVVVISLYRHALQGGELLFVTKLHWLEHNNPDDYCLLTIVRNLQYCTLLYISS